MCIDDFVVGDDSTGTTAELTDVEILRGLLLSAQTKTLPRLYPSAPLPTSTEASAVLALPHRNCSAIEGTGLSLVERLNYVEEVVYNMPGYLLQYFKPKE
ncbi:hypothetical protein HPB48_016729 [Haemaphysalis longicornis]|uniref:Uncharacterized protein n=1 Tax=Haemaphysalis longicornis TaxID=44386 RepID=A0A9J6FSB3_HAELO|nr:hypothetical protein HPB48_016729 [Haemaphysalis longicornis]